MEIPLFTFLKYLFLEISFIQRINMKHNLKLLDNTSNNE